MKKISRGSALLLTATLILSGCQAKKTSDANNQQTPPAQNGQVAQQTPSPEIKNPEIQSFFADYVNSDARPIAVMIDNDNEQARPQAGLEDAYLIYEMVVEGGATRFMALFKNADTEKIGPVRSSRHYFLDYALENDVIYTHYGWSPKAQSDISSLRVNNLNGIAGDGEIFWRNRDYTSGWHSAFTSIANIKEKAASRKYSDTASQKNAITYSAEYLDMKTDTAANSVMLNYSGKYKTGYTYDAETKLYEKSINGKPHEMQSGETVKVRNIIIQLIGDSSLGDGTDRRNVITTGSGKGYYITDGYVKSIKWSKSSRTGQTTYTDEDGNALEINPGKTFINIISPNAKITME